jgi:hypothetical protein
MIDQPQSSLPGSSSKSKASSSSSNQSPEMARNERKKPISMKKRGNVSHGSPKSGSQNFTNNNNTNIGTGSGILGLRGKNLPPRPPPVPVQPLLQPPALIEEKSNEPPSHLQCGSSEDLSFADFSAMEDSIDDCYYTCDTNNNEYTHTQSMSAFFNDTPESPNSINHPQAHRRSSSQNTRKVSAVDVASVGNASDTPVQQYDRHPNHNNQNMIVATRDLHEKAKLAFNAAKYHEALPLFESILSAQVRRFSSTMHPSVGAAMHNVGVR